MHFRQPPRMNTPEGSQRRIGVELEFAGVGLQRISEIIARMAEGEIEPVNRFEHDVTGAAEGKYTVLMDSRVLHSARYLEFLSKLGIDGQTPETLHDIEQLLEDVAGMLVPYEVVTPPLPFKRLDFSDRLRETLRAAGAVGTTGSPFYAFGLHLNVEAASLEAGWLLAMLRAYVLLEEWIAHETEVIVTRKMSSFIDPFPVEYVAKLLDPSYDPDLKALMTDYLEYNPTRNRSLDMLPLFCHLDCDLVHGYPVEHHKMKPRPAFHYRLPNCKIDEPDWRVAIEWNYWVDIERLAEDRELLDAMSRDFLKRPGFPGRLLVESWPDRVNKWLER